jgi:hypothetical protein
MRGLRGLRHLRVGATGPSQILGVNRDRHERRETRLYACILAVRMSILGANVSPRAVQFVELREKPLSQNADQESYKSV